MLLYLHYGSEPNQRHTFHKYCTGFNILPSFCFIREPTNKSHRSMLFFYSVPVLTITGRRYSAIYRWRLQMNGNHNKKGSPFLCRLSIFIRNLFRYYSLSYSSIILSILLASVSLSSTNQIYSISSFEYILSIIFSFIFLYSYFCHISASL